MQTGKFKQYHRSITYYLSQIHESYKKIVIKKIQLALSLSDSPISGTPTLEEAFKNYGKAVYRVWLIRETNRLLMQAWGRFSCIEPWADETWKMYELATISEALWIEMIDTLIYHQSHPK